MNLDHVRSHLTGPLGSLRTPFNRDGSIDYAGVRRMIDFILATGCRTTLITAGDSHFECMSDDEQLELNRVAAEHTAGRGMTVGADWQLGLPQAKKFAAECKAFGVDILMTRPADWANSCTAQGIVDFYAAIAEIIPVMVVTNLFANRPPAFGYEVMRRALDIPNILAVKDDLRNDFAREVSMMCHEKWAVFSGGGMCNHLTMHPFGCDGFMDRHMNFKPEITYAYWNAIQKNDVLEAGRIARDVEKPLDEHMSTYPGGRDAAVHGLIEIFGIAGRWRRPPYHSLTDTEMTKLKSFVKDRGLID